MLIPILMLINTKFYNTNKSNTNNADTDTNTNRY